MDYKGIIMGLGNPGPKYATTRHNVGFMVVDAVLEEADAKHYRRCDKLPGSEDFELWSVSLPRVRGDFLLAKPLTFMNLSGRAALRICKDHGVAPAHLLVIHDEMDLPLGRIKLKMGGGAAGHNGILSIMETLGTADFMRMRIGIGRAVKAQMKEHVLSEFEITERDILIRVLAAARDILPTIFGQSLQEAMGLLHPFDASKAI